MDDSLAQLNKETKIARNPGSTKDYVYYPNTTSDIVSDSLPVKTAFKKHVEMSKELGFKKKTDAYGVGFNNGTNNAIDERLKMAM
jgi:hypothetical protein